MLSSEGLIRYKGLAQYFCLSLMRIYKRITSNATIITDKKASQDITTIKSSLFSFPLFILLAIFSVPASSQPYFYINHQEGDSIAVFSKSDLSLKATIPSLEGPTGIAISPNNPWFAVSYPEQGMISFFDVEKLIPLEHVSVGGTPFGLVFANNRLFYSDWHNDYIGVINPGTGRVIKKISVGKSPAGVIDVACQSQVWVVNRESDSVSVIDSDSLKVIKTISVGKAPFAIEVDEQYVYVANAQDNTLSIIEIASLVEIKQIKTGRMPYGVAIDQKLHKVYVTNQLSNSVSVIDSRTHKMIKQLKTGEYPENIAIDEVLHRLYVLNWFDGSLSVFDSRTDQEIKRIAVGEGSRAFGRFSGNTKVCLKKVSRRKVSSDALLLALVLKQAM